ncbi:type II 3-dehydroquinate dehydratase [Aeribacillus sp. FSL K6-8394]|uniref:type II 3-dehydroquinate dehydratase n=1 Tax=Aeribacillus sp. FSL K6-8394 TaxID=2954570 RepID=UPI0030F580C3
MERILVINGPNLNYLGVREPHIYGKKTLADLENELKSLGEKKQVQFSFFQSNHEGEIIDKLYEADQQFDGVILNPGAFTHYSYAIRDAIASISKPVIEVHISNTNQREPFRHHSVTAPVTQGQIIGLGFYGYQLAALYLLHLIREETHEA